ncbi:MAG: RNase adapter RapZ [Coprobacillus cateniformis]|uniref:RNase adapter RapZ n=1 Tax=Longibaculum muris TaxID=1796628 RepID=UPI003AB66B4C|nr:RNase adapter RapZ [Coprobacillus cateniformis]
MDKIEVVIVTGMSGAGKTQAMAIFENMEYRCIDNYPVALLKEFGDLMRTSTKYAKVAMAVSLGDAILAVRVLSNMDWIDLTVIFLDCDDEVLLSRYKQTRRSHPLMIGNMSSSLMEAIHFEREMADPVSKLANIVIDTTLLKPSKLQDKLEIYFHKGNQDTFRVSFVSFGYKHGVPRDADLLLDVRFLPNPFYIEELRYLTGNDKAVYDYVMEQAETKEFIEKTITYYDYLLKKYEEEGKMQMIIGIGCTGGQHRSVTLTNYFADYYSKYYQVYKWHRDADH